MSTSGVRIRITPGLTERWWCDRCLTSAGVRVNLGEITETGVWHVGTLSWCQRCDPDAAVRG